MFRKAIEDSLEKGGEYAPYAVTGAAIVGTLGFFAYKSYQTYYKFEKKPNGSIIATPVPGARADASRAQAKQDVEVIALGHGPLDASGADSKSTERNVRVRAVDTDTPLDKISAVLNPLSFTQRPQVADSQKSAVRLPASLPPVGKRGIPSSTHASADGAIAGRDIAVSNGFHYYLPQPEKEPLPKVFNPNIPSFAKDRFVKRDAPLSQLYATFSSDHDDKQPVHPRVLTAYNGLGGVGKTQLALYYYHHSPKPYVFQCWFSAEQENQLDQQYREFCERFHISFDEKTSPVIAAKVKQWLEEHPGWLLIYDNVKDCETIAPYLPKTGGDILLTSRHTIEWDQIGGKVVPVNVLDEKEAIELVKRAISLNGIPQKLSVKEEISLKALVKELGYLPLALAQAAAYIKKIPPMTITGYLEKYLTTPDALLDQPLAKEVYQKSVAKTWLITMEEVQKQLPVALEIFKACAYLAPDNIPNELLLRLVERLNFREEKRETSTSKSKLLLDQILGCLLSFSMIDYQKETGQISIHRLVQVVIRQNDKNDKFLSEEELLTKRLEPLAKALYDLYQRIYNERTIDLSIGFSITMHVQAIYQALMFFVESEYGSKKSVIALQSNLLMALGDSFNWILGKPAEAEKYYQQFFKLSKIAYGEASEQTATALQKLCDAEKLLGNLNNAVDYGLKSLKIMKAVHDEQHPSVAISYNNLGTVYKALGDADKALAYHKKALSIRLSCFGNKHIDVAISYTNLGNVYQELLGEASEALKLHKKALAIRLAIRGEKHPDVAISYNCLGNSHQALGNMEEALTCQEKALNIRLEIYNDGHLDLGKSYEGLGNIHRELGNATKAFECHEKALTIYLKIYGEKHPNVAASYRNLGRTYDSFRGIKKATECYKKALIIYQHLGREREIRDVTLCIEKLNGPSSRSNCFSFSNSKKSATDDLLSTSAEAPVYSRL